MAGNARLRRQCMARTALLLLAISIAASADDGARPPLPGDLSVMDEANQLLVSGVEVEAASAADVDDSDGNGSSDQPPGIRGMLYHYEPILPPYDGRYLEGELLPPVPLEKEDVEESNGNDASAAKVEASDVSVVAEERQGVDGTDLDSDARQTGQIEDVDADADAVNNAADEIPDESVAEPEDIAKDDDDDEDEANTTKNVIAEDSSEDDSIVEASGSSGSSDAKPQTENTVASEEEQASALADGIVEAAMALDEDAVESIAKGLGDELAAVGEEEGDNESSSEDSNEDSSSTEDMSTSTTSDSVDSAEDLESMQANDDDIVDENAAEDADILELPLGTDGEEPEHITANDESQPPTVIEVESPKASDNSYVAAEKSTMPRTSGKEGENRPTLNATSLAEHNASAAGESTEADDDDDVNGIKDNGSPAEIGGDDALPADENSRQATIDSSGRPAEHVRVGIESEEPPSVMREGSTDARRIAEEKGVPTTIEGSDSTDSGANATDDSDFIGDESPALEKGDSMANESLLVTQEVDGEAGAVNAGKGQESWRGVYERELDDDEELQSEDTQSTETDSETKWSDIESLHNVMEYVASKGEEISGLIPPEAASPRHYDATDADEVANIEDTSGGQMFDYTTEIANEDIAMHKEIQGDDFPERSETDQSDSTGEAAVEEPSTISNESSMSDDQSNIDSFDAKQPVSNDAETTDISSNLETEEGADDSIDDLPDISSLRDSLASSNVNSDFIDGIDDLDKFLEEVDTPDELDVAHGSSMQEVLVSKSVQILIKKVNAVVRRVKFVASKIKYRVGNSVIAAKIREGIETSGIIALGEKVREASNISEHREKVVGLGQKLGQFVDDKLDAVNTFFDDLMDNDFVASAKAIVGRITSNSVVRRILSALGLSDEDEEDDDLMDFSSFSQMQQKGGGTGEEASLEDRLAAMRQMY